MGKRQLTFLQDLNDGEEPVDVVLIIWGDLIEGVDDLVIDLSEGSCFVRHTLLHKLEANTYETSAIVYPPPRAASRTAHPSGRLAG